MSSTLIYKDYIDKLNDDNEAAIEAFILKEECDDYLDDHSLNIF
jgi:hypothetical protein